MNSLLPYTIQLALPYEQQTDVHEFWRFFKHELLAEGFTVRDGMTITWDQPAEVRIAVMPYPGVNVSDAVRRALQDAPIRPTRMSVGQMVEMALTTKEVQHG